MRWAALKRSFEEVSKRTRQLSESFECLGRCERLVRFWNSSSVSIFLGDTRFGEKSFTQIRVGWSGSLGFERVPRRPHRGFLFRVVAVDSIGGPTVRPVPETPDLASPAALGPNVRLWRPSGPDDPGAPEFSMARRVPGVTGPIRSRAIPENPSEGAER